MVRIKKLLVLTICIGFVILIGCVPSLNPLYTDKDLVVLPGLVGIWVDQDKNTWVFEKKSELSYTLTYTKDSESEEIFDANLVRLNYQVFMDLYPQNGDSVFHPKDGLMRVHYVPGHTFSKIRLSKDDMEINMLNPEWLGKLKGEGRLNIKHEDIEDNGILLTAQTKDLQRFISTYAYDSQAFEKPAWRLTRQKKVEQVSISTTTTTQSIATTSMDTSTTTNSNAPTQDSTIPFLGKGISLANPTLYFAPLSIQAGLGQSFQLSIVMDNPKGIPIDDIGLWIRYDTKGLVLHETNQNSPFNWDSTFIYGWTPVMSYHYPGTGELFIRLKARDMQRTLSGILGTLEFEGIGKVSVSQVQFKFNSWNSLPNTFMTYKNKDTLGKESDHKDGTIGATIRIQKE